MVWHYGYNYKITLFNAAWVEEMISNEKRKHDFYLLFHQLVKKISWNSLIY